jgi:hypothetical protein
MIKLKDPPRRGKKAQGLPWVSRSKRFALKGLGKRSVPALPAGEVNERAFPKMQSEDASLTYLLALSGQIRVGGLPRVNPGLCSIGRFGP